MLLQLNFENESPKQIEELVNLYRIYIYSLLWKILCSLRVNLLFVGYCRKIEMKCRFVNIYALKDDIERESMWEE